MVTTMNTMSGAVYGVRGSRALRYTESDFTRRAPLTNSAIGRIFTAAILLTGCMKQAEAAMLEAIRQMDPEQASDQTLLLDCVKASIAPGRQSKALAGDAESAWILPPELKPILSLAPDLRHGFVLRILLGLSDEDCARLNIPNANRYACVAAQKLAGIGTAKCAMTA